MGVAAFVAATGELALCGGYLTIAGAFYWWSGLLLSIVLFCGLWTTAEKCLPLRRLPCLAGEVATDKEALVKVRYPQGRNIYEPRIDPYSADSFAAAPLMTSYATAYFSSNNASVNASSAAAYGKYGYLHSSHSSGYSVAHSTAGPKLVNIKPQIMREILAAKLRAAVKMGKGGGKGGSGNSRPNSGKFFKTTKGGAGKPKTAQGKVGVGARGSISNSSKTLPPSKSFSRPQKGVPGVGKGSGLKLKKSKVPSPSIKVKGAVGIGKDKLLGTAKGNEGGGGTPKSNRKKNTSISPKKVAKISLKKVKSGSGGGGQ